MNTDKIEQNIQCVGGTMKLEGLSLAEELRINLSRYGLGEAIFDEILHEFYDKFFEPVEDGTTYTLEDKND